MTANLARLAGSAGTTDAPVRCMFGKIACAIDFSPGSDQALHGAIRMAKDQHAELVIVHVGGAPWLVPTRYPFPADLIERMTHENEAGLAAAAREATRGGVQRVSTRLVNGTPWHEIAQLVETDTEIDLVVIGTHGRTGLARVLVGSVAEQVVRNAPCSVLAVRPRRELEAFEHVLCPIDFSESSRRAVEVGAALVTPGGAGITLLHAIELPVVYSVAEVDTRSIQLVTEWADELSTKTRAPISVAVETGSPGARALDALDRDPTFDLVVVGSHGRTGLKRMLLGSVAEKIVRHAPCPVLVARPRR